MAKQSMDTTQETFQSWDEALRHDSFEIVEAICYLELLLDASLEELDRLSLDQKSRILVVLLIDYPSIVAEFEYRQDNALIRKRNEQLRAVANRHIDEHQLNIDFVNYAAYIKRIYAAYQKRSNYLRSNNE